MSIQQSNYAKKQRKKLTKKSIIDPSQHCVCRLKMTWENFERSEFACKCGCNTNEIKDSFIDVLQEIRTKVGSPLVISSGYRCDKHPIEAAKPAPGEHNDGTCADIRVSYRTAFEVNKAASNQPKVTAIGVSQKGDEGGRFLHIGIGPAKSGRPRPHIWSY